MIEVQSNRYSEFILSAKCMQPLKISSDKQSVLEAFKNTYRDMMTMDIPSLDAIYTGDIVFKDPVHKIKGLPALQEYLDSTMQNVHQCRFEFLDQTASEHSAYLKWNMHFSHPRLSKGKILTVRGVSQIEFDEKIYYHEDIYDLGAMLYEHLPLFGAVNRSVKKRMASR